MPKVLEITRLYVWQHNDPCIEHLVCAAFGHWDLFPAFTLRDNTADLINIPTSDWCRDTEDNQTQSKIASIEAKDDGDKTKLTVRLTSNVVINLGWDRKTRMYYSISIDFGAKAKQGDVIALIKALGHRVRAFDVSVKTDGPFEGIRADHPDVTAFCAEHASTA